MRGTTAPKENQMSNVKFYATKSKDGSPRHIAVATSDVTEGKVALELLGFHPSVEGTARRGKKPDFTDPVSVSELLEVSTSDVPAELQQKALAALAPAQQSEEN